MTKTLNKAHYNLDGLVQDCSISIANALEILTSCTKQSISSGCDGDEIQIDNASLI